MADIRRWHLANGGKDIGYRGIMDRDGKVLMGRAIEWTRKRAFNSADDDWVVLRDGLVVGRVYYDISQN
ncbi:hypothetical protein E4L95_22035 [Paracoccus liaowanqingii]|uniref:Uncharacterized protein n=1 Tax=Paracoccus liaowanqingii TaxID=2560053 RepID=A0A4Z1B8Y8_9RHOB|nr:hypothetical protein [Paracoccus liaowanqingii]TGN37900.1 hypothetical protein E4L95_22035 [Paracoccus liaowanqingii]